MSEFNIGDFVKVEKADVWRADCVGEFGIVVNNPNPSNACVRVKFANGTSVDFKPSWLKIANPESMEDKAPYGVSHTDDRPVISFDENADKTRLIPKSVFRFRDIIDEMAKTYEKKNADYNDSFRISVRKYGNIAALTRISDKFNRIENLILNGNAQVKDESLLDSLKDLACYCVMTVMAIENNDFENVE